MQAQGFLSCDSAPAHPAHPAHWPQAAPLTQMSWPSGWVGSQIRHFPIPGIILPSLVDAIYLDPQTRTLARACLPGIFSRNLLFLGRRSGEKSTREGFEGGTSVAGGSGGA